MPPAIGLFESAALSTTAANTLPTHPQIDTHDQCTTTDYSINYYLKINRLTKIVCHPERRAQPVVEGSSYCRLLFRYISANRSFDSLRSLRMTTPLVLYQAYSSNSNLSPMERYRAWVMDVDHRIRWCDIVSGGIPANSNLSSRSSNVKPSLPYLQE